jgi:hypothetical protein
VPPGDIWHCASFDTVASVLLNCVRIQLAKLAVGPPDSCLIFSVCGLGLSACWRAARRFGDKKTTRFVVRCAAHMNSQQSSCDCKLRVEFSESE